MDENPSITDWKFSIMTRANPSVSEVEADLRRLLNFLRPFLPMIECHFSDYITEDHWNKFPSYLADEVRERGTEESLKALFNGTGGKLGEAVAEAKKHIIDHCSCYRPLHEIRSAFSWNAMAPEFVREFMTEKKKHEVAAMSELIAAVASSRGIGTVLDAGSGKGYLSCALVLQHNFRVLAVDCSSVRTKGAGTVGDKIEKQWEMTLKKKGDDCRRNRRVEGKKENLSCYEEYYRRYGWKSSIREDRFKRRLQNIDEFLDVAGILEEEFAFSKEEKCCLTSLHACGDLTAGCLKLFVKNEIVDSLIVVGCCYNLMETPEGSPMKFGFPMSCFLKDVPFAFGRDARMLASQAPAKVLGNFQMIHTNVNPLFYRALFQELLARKSPSWPDCRKVGRLAHKCRNFAEYAEKATKKLHLQPFVTEDELKALQEEYTEHYERMGIFFTLKTVLSEVVESVILLDRILYLREKGFHNSFVTRSFDATLSPRCFAILATK